ncbi:Uncharacterized protein FKW44_004068 [Caligus rogercresseyi]|uniref:Uncharacterized protein n=1 Tax=Caligus rogercresseyi TaxID=217165 RepID=A0A7T8KB94_CALRO|nr:Uncharacterized protein FKW44_004068 [Caligus rogercresseyi]
MDPNGVVVAQGIGAEAAYNEYHGLPGTASSRVGNNTYGDRKKKIIKEWTKIHTSESSSEGGPRPYLPPPGASDFLSPYYSHHIKDEPAFRAAVEYQQYTQYYQESSLHPPYGGGPMVAEGLPGLLPAGPTPSRRKERKKKNGSSSSSGHPPVQSPGLSGLSRDERKALTLGLPFP